MNRLFAAPTMTGSAPSVTSVINCPPTISGWPFNSSRAPGASVSVPVVVSGAESVMRPAITRLENTPAAVLPLPVSTVWPRPTIVRPASALLVTVSVKPFVSSVAPGSRNRSRTVTFCRQPRDHGGRHREVDARALRRNSAWTPVGRVVPVAVQAVPDGVEADGRRRVDLDRERLAIPPLWRAAIDALHRKDVVSRRGRRARQRAARAERHAGWQSTEARDDEAADRAGRCDHAERAVDRRPRRGRRNL